MAALDEALGGGLVPGTLAVIVGATGIGKSHLGMSIANAGRNQERHPGLILDLASRGDDQGEKAIARRLHRWSITEKDGLPGARNLRSRPASFDLYRPFAGLGLGVTKDPERWALQLQTRLQLTAAFLYQGFAQGRKRVIVDGIEPLGERPSSQAEFIETVFEQYIRLEPEWLAREALRENFRFKKSFVDAHRYDEKAVTTVLLVTAREIMLEDLIRAPIPLDGPEYNASTLILMGWREEHETRCRSLRILKHRGSNHRAEELEFDITEKGFQVV
ncbi:MAG: hypothetical protein HYT87_16565 [Nitrospirae bacterium]|nr:hypothetical protein [Nitrospirota bacterium]